MQRARRPAFSGRRPNEKDGNRAGQRRELFGRTGWAPAQEKRTNEPLVRPPMSSSVLAKRLRGRSLTEHGYRGRESAPAHPYLGVGVSFEVSKPLGASTPGRCDDQSAGGPVAAENFEDDLS